MQDAAIVTWRSKYSLGFRFAVFSMFRKNGAAWMPSSSISMLAMPWLP